MDSVVHLVQYTHPYLDGSQTSELNNLDTQVTLFIQQVLLFCGTGLQFYMLHCCERVLCRYSHTHIHTFIDEYMKILCIHMHKLSLDHITLVYSLSLVGTHACPLTHSQSDILIHKQKIRRGQSLIHILSRSVILLVCRRVFSSRYIYRRGMKEFMGVLIKTKINAVKCCI